MKISERVANIAPSPTMEGARKAKIMRAEGKDVLSFAVGEPDFPTPANVIEAAKRIMDDGKTKYTAASGIDELKQAIVDATSHSIGVTYSTSEVCVSNGAKHALSNIFATLVDPGDEVVILAPYWVTYPELIKLYGGTAVEILAGFETNFQPDLEQIEAAITDKTVAICINSPNNPTGAVLCDEAVRGIADLCIEHDIVLISDEIYKDILFDDLTYKSPAALPGMKDRTIIIDGVAKSYAMTGWRIGWSLAPADFTKALGSLQSQQASNPNTIAQWAVVEALNGPQDSVAAMRAEFEKRRNYIVPALQAIEGIECAIPSGAFYAFPNISAYFGKTLHGYEINSSEDMADYLLNEALISTVLGTAFGAEGYVRFSFACAMEQIEEGITRLRKALES